MKTIITQLINNQTSKHVCYLMFWILAVLMVSCNKNLEVDISPPDENPPEENPPVEKPPVETPEPIVFNTADCTNMGDILGNGTVCFMLQLYDVSDNTTGLMIMGFIKAPVNANDFRLESQTYPVSMFGVVNTLLPGMYEPENKVVIGTYLMNSKTGKLTYVSDGTMTVTQSGNTCTIDCQFNGEDAITGALVEGMDIGFSGQMRYLDPLPAKSTYSATATPKWITPPGPSTWEGTIGPNANLTRFAITNWGRIGITVFCNVIDGKMRIDDYTKLFTLESYDAYFRVAFIDYEAQELVVLESYDYIIHFTPLTRILDFSGTIRYNGKNYPALMAVVGYTEDGEPERVYNDFYENVRFQLTPEQLTSGYAATTPSNQINALLQNMTSAPLKSEPLFNRPSTLIEADKLDKSQIKRVPLKNLRFVNGMNNEQ